MNLHESREDFEILVLKTSEYLKIPIPFIERDYWLCFLLKRILNFKHLDSNNSIIADQNNVVFKGGTSLSKAYKIINRFSEDIDLAIDYNDSWSRSKIRNVISKLSKELIVPPLNKDDNPKNQAYENIRRTYVSYPKNTKDDTLREQILLEINGFARPVPKKKYSISTYIYQYIQEQLPEDIQNELVSKFSLEPFELNVLSIERTFCEKISSVAKASFKGERILQDKIRHIYDLHILLQLKDIQNLITSQKRFGELINIIKKDDKGARFTYSKTDDIAIKLWLEKPYYQAEIFYNPDSFKKLARFYENNFVKLLFKGKEDLPPIIDIIESLTVIRDALKNL
ncbi:conserved hypothetical protein (plasmid) [Deferribacter desulfuricans SSM1]|uniref:Nucleotidyl transferase AbiEii/AbiGii toxin family protein n=1 Tax=Deferribacter desulfuricans (strain DSM 14783 / JCM 11476 / NBRC 101012 / SSM1) TaxID=639282 RepID=D3PF91_DEFDS|nr:nucleotidyl transferase AbiEii/AbiGii toxin family protein [Deferribacter desulfuricans]BAI81883.1 conserved hypothetical protein [Deferribacter desulfuricans SSM1]